MSFADFCQLHSTFDECVRAGSGLRSQWIPSGPSPFLYHRIHCCNLCDVCPNFLFLEWRHQLRVSFHDAQLPSQCHVRHSVSFLKCSGLVMVTLVCCLHSQVVLRNVAHSLHCLPCGGCALVHVLHRVPSRPLIFHLLWLSLSACFFQAWGIWKCKFACRTRAAKRGGKCCSTYGTRGDHQSFVSARRSFTFSRSKRSIAKSTNNGVTQSLVKTEGEEVGEFSGLGYGTQAEEQSSTV